jgi:hypothetical protein
MSVYSIGAGTSVEVGAYGTDNEFIRVGGYRYVHVRASAAVLSACGANGTPGVGWSGSGEMTVKAVTDPARTLIGSTNSLNHVHLEEGDSFLNPLRPGALQPWTDSTSPVFVEDVAFFLDGLTNSNETSSMSSKTSGTPVRKGTCLSN